MISVSYTHLDVYKRQGLDRYLTDKLEIPVWVSETALTNVVSGCLKVLETPTALKQTLMRSK